MNDFERKLHATPFRTPPAELRDEILISLTANALAAGKPSTPTAAETSPQRWFGKTNEDRARGKARPLVSFLLKPATIFCLFIATIMTGGAALFVGANSAGKTSWERYSDDARARGVKMSLQELLPAPIPDAENFAAVPLIANLFSEDEAVRKKATDALDLNFLDRGKEARLAAFDQATLCRLAGWQSSFVKIDDLPAASADPAADVLQALEHRFGPALVELAEAERRPGAVFPVKWELGFAARLPHLGFLQSAAKVHALRMSAHLAQRDPAAAYAEFGGLLRLYHALEKEPTLIDGLVRISILQMAFGGVWEGVVTSAWDSSSLQKIEADLSGIDLLEDALFAFASERACMNDTLESTRSGKLPVTGTESGLESDPARLMLLRAVPKIPGWISLNQTALNRFYDQFPRRIDVAGALFVDTGTTNAELEMIDRSIVKQHIYVLYRLLIPGLASVEKTFLHAHSVLQICTLACALERRRLAEGQFPETLEALAPKYVTALPHDVITGAPLIYRRTEDGHFLLYSVGMNGKDDGGAIGEKKSGNEQLDWSWRWPAP